MTSRLPAITRPPQKLHNLAGADTIIIAKAYDEAYIHVAAQHFHPEISHGDHVRWNPLPQNLDTVRTYRVLTNIPHPRGVRGVWWAELFGAPISVTVLGHTYWSWKLGSR